MKTARWIGWGMALTIGAFACGSSSSSDGSGTGAPSDQGAGGSSAAAGGAIANAGSSGKAASGAAGSTSTSAGGATTSGSGGVSATGGAGASGGTTSQGGNAVVSPPNCQPSCTSPADCAVTGSEMYDASHYQCTSGRCQWLGCDSDMECQTTFGKPNYACRQVTGASYKNCGVTCTAPADCTTANVPIYDASHYTCDGGACQWLGCNTDDECQKSLSKSNYACAPLAGTSLKSCQPTCSAPADCATPSVEIYTADHYTCVGGLCDWEGCKSDMECTDTFMKPGYVCK